jgi:uncharacterized protein with PIN domain
VTSSEPCFIADRMLGRLARYLRLMGYDVSYPPSTSDAHLIAMARAEGRVLLTRDHGISLREGPRAGAPVVIEIRSSQILHQLRQLVQEGWVTRFLEPRCPVCNARLKAMEEWEARHLLPPYTLATQESFNFCRSCNCVLWEGSHWKDFRARIAHALNPR